MADRILVVDDEQIIRESLSFVLKKEGYQVEEAANGKEALAKQEARPFDVVITDIEMPEMRGMELLEQITKRTPQTFIIIITAFASIESAVAALRKGAYDYVLKPIDFDDILHRIRKLLEHRALSLENSLLRQEINRTYDFDQIIGQSQSMKNVFEIIRRVHERSARVPARSEAG